MKYERPTWCHLLFYFTSYVLNMFRTLIYPSSGACDFVVELPHRSSCSQFVLCSPNKQRTENKTTDVVIHQHSRKLLKMDILMSETCWAHNKWNKIASDIKLVLHSSRIALFEPWRWDPMGLSQNVGNYQCAAWHFSRAKISFIPAAEVWIYAK